jgi:hypothetical protein
MQTVFKIEVSDTFGNSHFTNRDETWTVIRMGSFPKENDAKEYVIGRTKLFVPELSIFLINIPDDEKNKFCHQFCFTDDKYYTKRKFFIGKPNLKKMIELLKKENIQIKNSIV